MRENFTYGSVGRAPGDRCLYPEADRPQRRLICAVRMLKGYTHCLTLKEGLK